MISQQQEHELINRILTGEENLYAELVDEYKSYAYTIALKIVSNRPEAEEIAQDAFIKAFQHLDSFNKQARFSTWLYRIVFNTAISHKRKNKQLFESIENVKIDNQSRADRDLEQEDKEVFIAKAMNKLNDADRLAMQLYYIKEFPLDEVAEMMGQQMNTIKVRVHRARLRLAEELRNILKEEALTL